MNYKGYNNLNNSIGQGPNQAINIRPVAIGKAIPDPRLWIKPSVKINVLYEEYPDLVVKTGRYSGLLGHPNEIYSNFEPTFLSAPCCDDPMFDCGFEEDPPIESREVARICVPYLGRPDSFSETGKLYDSETESYFCLRTSKYLIRLWGQLERNSGNTSSCEEELDENVECGIRVTAWLLDNEWHNQDVLCWSNKDSSFNETGFKIEMQMKATIGYPTGFVNFDRTFLVELPNAIDGAPPKIYGYYCYCEQDPKTSSQQERGYTTMELCHYREDNRRYLDESGEYLPATRGWPWSVSDYGYIGEWENGPYKPIFPYAYRVGYFDGSKDTVTVAKDSSNNVLNSYFKAIDATQNNNDLKIYVTAQTPVLGTVTGSGDILGGNSIKFTPNPGVTGLTRITYYAKNNLGKDSSTVATYLHLKVV